VQTAATPTTPASVSGRKRRRPLRTLLLALIALVLTLCYPPFFQFGIRQFLKIDAFRHGVRLQVGKIDGSIIDPLLLYDLRITHTSAAGTVTQLESAKARATFSWKNLLFRRGVNFWQELVLDNVTGTIDLPAEPKQIPPEKIGKSSDTKQIAPAFPATLELRNAKLVLRQNGDNVRLDNLSFRASNVGASEIRIGNFSIKQPWLQTNFANLRGTIALQDSRLTIADIKLEDALVIQNASADLPELLRGRLKMEFALGAFGGSIRGELRNAQRDQHLNFEGSGTFSQISIAQLASFLNEDADGAIKEGKFTFRGSPRNLPKATFSTRFEATDFRWEKRQWNSFVLGATLINRRLMIPEFQLVQAHNSLSLTGEMAIPENWRAWWQNDFNFKIAAKIGNLSELSALFGPDFANMSGQLAVGGELHGQKQAFNGELSVSGAQLSYRTAPLDKLDATLKLNGNELQIAKAELVHGSDFLRGDGVVNILGEKRYWGEVKASIADLALYSAFMQPPITPQAFAGGLVLDWSGDGSAKAHSGAFTAHLKKIRALGSADAHPLNLDAEGTYSPESIFFSTFALSDGETNFSARVVANPQSLTLQSLRLTRKNDTWLEGDAQLPLNVWAAWQNPAQAAWWNFESPCKLNLSVQNLSLRETLLLSGKEQPLRGEISGKISSDGTLANLSMNGALQVHKASAAIAPLQLKSGDADLAFAGDAVAVKSLHAVANDFDFTADGAVTLHDVRTPNLALALHMRSFPLTPSPELHIETVPDIHLDGAPETARVSGSVRITSAMLDRKIDVTSLVEQGGSGLDAPLSPLSLAQIPFPKWQLDFDCIGFAPLTLANSSGNIAPQLHVTGTPTNPRFSGELEVTGFAVSTKDTKLTIDSGALFFSDPNTPTLMLRAKGITCAVPFSGAIFGSRNDKKFAWESELDSDSITNLLGTGRAARELNSDLPETPISLQMQNAPANAPLQ